MPKRNDLENVAHIEQKISIEALRNISGGILEALASHSNVLESKMAGSLEDSLHVVLDISREYFQAEIGALFLKDTSEESTDKQRLLLEWVSGKTNAEKFKDCPSYDIADGLRPNGGITPWVFQTMQPFNADSFMELKTKSNGHWKGNWDGPMYNGHDNAERLFKCVYIVPLLSGNTALGVLKFENRTSSCNMESFDAEDQRQINLFAQVITFLVIVQRMERNRYNVILPSISTKLVSSMSNDMEFYDSLVSECIYVCGADLCALFLVDVEGNLNLISVCGSNIDERKKAQLARFSYKNYLTADGLTPQILRNQKAFIAKSYLDLVNRSEGKHIGAWDNIIYDGDVENQFRSLYATPLIFDDKVIGLLKIENKNVPPLYFSESDSTICDLIGRIISIGVQYWNARYKEEREASITRHIRAQSFETIYGGLAHKYKNHLQRFVGMISCAKQLQSISGIHDTLSQLEKSIQGCIKEILITNKSINNKIETFCINSVIKEIVDLYATKYQENSIIVTLYPCEDIDVHMRPSDIWYIMINLIENAVDSIIEKGEKNGRINVLVTPADENKVVITISDTGNSIPYAAQNRIFEYGYTTKKDGMGIGLALVANIVKQINGSVNFKSPNELGGTTFQIHIPCNTY